MPVSLIQRQLLFIDYQISQQASRAEEVPQQSSSSDNLPYYEWPRMAGLSDLESRRVFKLMEEIGLVVGFPMNGGFLFTLTPQGHNTLANAKRGQGINNLTEALNEQQQAMLDNIGGKSIFIVHGYANNREGFHKEVERFIIGATGRDAKVLDPAVSKQLWSEFQKQAAECGAAVCIWDADRENPESKYIRPNVLLETGYFLSSLGTNRVIIIVCDEGLKHPSDLAGIVWANKDDWREKLPSALYAAFSEG